VPQSILEYPKEIIMVFKKGEGIWIGRKHKPESKIKMSLFQKNRVRQPLSENTKLKIGLANKGKKRTYEQCKLISESHKGIKQTLISKLKRRDKMLGKIIGKGPRIVFNNREYSTYVSRGYLHLTINRKPIRYHVALWESIYGPRPKGYHIHHKDNNSLNNNLDNLELLSAIDHHRIHNGWTRDSNGKFISKKCVKCNKEYILEYYKSFKLKRCNNLSYNTICNFCLPKYKSIANKKYKLKRKIELLKPMKDFEEEIRKV